jgi:fluoroacetyl-CoA thioesterase
LNYIYLKFEKMDKLKIGIEGFLEKTVLSCDSAKAYGSGLVDVFSTPAMIAFMENTAQQSVQEYLSEGFTTVGTEVNIKHLKATPINARVNCKSKLVNIDGKKLLFEVQAFDEEGMIGSGFHTRFVINMDKFMKNIQTK